MSDTTIDTANAGNADQQTSEQTGFTPITSGRAGPNHSAANRTRALKVRGLRRFQGSSGARAWIERRAQVFETTEARNTLVSKVAKDTGVDAALIANYVGIPGRAKAAVAPLAERLRPTAPVIPGQDKRPANAPQDELSTFRNSLFGWTSPLPRGVYPMAVFGSQTLRFRYPCNIADGSLDAEHQHRRAALRCRADEVRQRRLPDVRHLPPRRVRGRGRGQGIHHGLVPAP